MIHLPSGVDVGVVDTNSEIHEGFEGGGVLPPQTLLVIDVHHPTIRPTGNVPAVWGDCECRTKYTALISKTVDTVASGEVPHIDLPITYIVYGGGQKCQHDYFSQIVHL